MASREEQNGNVLPNEERHQDYLSLAEAVQAMPEGLPDLLDEIFADSPGRRGYMGHDSAGYGVGIGAALTLVNSSIGDRLVQDLSRHIGMGDLRPNFWSHYEEGADRGHGAVYVHWHSKSYGNRLQNYLSYGAKDGEMTPYQEMLVNYWETAESDEQRERLQALFYTEPEWVGDVINYTALQAKRGLYPQGIEAELIAFFRGNAPATYFTPEQKAMIAADGSYDRALAAKKASTAA